MIYHISRDAFSDKSRKERGNIQEVILFDRYLVLSELGRGSGSIVYLVRHQKLGEYRVVKKILKDSDSAWKIREADILNHLKHPQIPCLYDIEEDDEAYYIVEEYVEGESLEALMLQSSFITPDFICHTVMEISNILDYMHHLAPDPMIYQDLKAEHVIVGKNGIKLIDFGIAVFLGNPGSKYQNYGTPEFCAPEKLTEAKISVQTDVYSLGKMLGELIYAEGFAKSQNLMHIAKKAVSADLSERYDSMRAFQEDLKKHMQSGNHSIYQKHLLKKIVVAGSQPRIGTTHLSVSFTEYLNYKGISAVCREKNASNHMRLSIQKGGYTEEGGLYRKGNFLGMPAYGDGVEVNVPEDAAEVLDYGTDIKGAVSEGADLLLLIIGSREWETENSNRAFEKVKYEKELAIISNYGDRGRAKQYAREYQRKVYCFPLDENPFFMTEKKEVLFDGLLEKYRNCSKLSRKRGDAFIRSIGKLCSKRAGRKDRLSGTEWP